MQGQSLVQEKLFKGCFGEPLTSENKAMYSLYITGQTQLMLRKPDTIGLNLKISQHLQQLDSSLNVGNSFYISTPN